MRVSRKGDAVRSRGGMRDEVLHNQGQHEGAHGKQGLEKKRSYSSMPHSTNLKLRFVKSSKCLRST